MKKAFENKPRFFFLVEVILVAVAVIAAFAAGYIYRDTAENSNEGKTGTTLTLSQESSALKKVTTEWGTVITITETEITLKNSSGKLVKYNINDKTSIVSYTKSTVLEVADVKVKSVAYITYETESKNALTISVREG